MSVDLKRQLFQFPLSPYCEKTRWHMDHKGLEYTTHNMFPGLHRRRAKKLADVKTLPMLLDKRRWIGDSSTIALYLEENYPERCLLPKSAARRAEVMALEAYFDGIGDDVRRWIFAYLINSPALGDMMFDPYPLPARLVGKAMMPVIRKGLQQLHRMSAQRVAASHIAMNEAMTRIEVLLQGNEKGYLVGRKLTLADITAASMLGPLLGPKGSPWDNDELLPAVIAEARKAARVRLAGRWLLNLYASERAPHQA